MRGREGDLGRILFKLCQTLPTIPSHTSQLSVAFNVSGVSSNKSHLGEITFMLISKQRTEKDPMESLKRRFKSPFISVFARLDGTSASWSSQRQFVELLRNYSGRRQYCAFLRQRNPSVPIFPFSAAAKMGTRGLGDPKSVLARSPPIVNLSFPSKCNRSPFHSHLIPLKGT